MLGAKQTQWSAKEADNEYLKKALAAWKDAQNYFDNVSDPDLIEFAVYDMQAAQRRYEYMIKCAKRGQKEPWKTQTEKTRETNPLQKETAEEQEKTKRIEKRAIQRMLRHLSGSAEEKHTADNE